MIYNDSMRPEKLELVKRKKTKKSEGSKTMLVKNETFYYNTIVVGFSRVFIGPTKFESDLGIPNHKIGTSKITYV